MSGYDCKLIVEFKTHSSKKYELKDIVEHFESFIRKQLETDGKIVKECIVNKFTNHFEIIFFDDFPIMSFNLFYEEREGKLMFLSIIDLVKASTELMMRGDFFNNFIDSIKEKHEICQAVLLGDSVFENYEQLFRDIRLNKRNSDIYIIRQFSQL